MTHWIFDLTRALERGVPAVLVSVAANRGSVPRGPGAHMVVTAHDCAGTIGGGQLEYRAIDIARAQLVSRNDGPQLLRFPLGASVGQCCGGVVQLSFETVDAEQHTWVALAAAYQREGRRWLRIASLNTHPANAVAVFDEASLVTPTVVRQPGGTPSPTHPALDDPRVAEQLQAMLADNQPSALLAGAPTLADASLQESTAARWLLDVSVPPELTVVLFGAGHVGRALVEVLGRLPLRVIWVDARDEELPASLPANVEARITDTPCAEVRAAPGDALFLVLTHSHALDFELTRAILDRGNFRFFGLIGSRSKRLSFERRLRERGYAETALAAMTCPIGLPGIAGKEPEIIAISVAAELLQLRGVSLSARRVEAPARAGLAA